MAKPTRRPFTASYRLQILEEADRCTGLGEVDLLVEFEPGAEPGLLGLAAMEAELSSPLGGRPVDLRTPRDLSRRFRDEVMRTAEGQYAR